MKVVLLLMEYFSSGVDVVEELVCWVGLLGVEGSDGSLAVAPNCDEAFKLAVELGQEVEAESEANSFYLVDYVFRA